MSQGKLHVPTEASRKLVREWSGLGQPQEVIARRLNFSIKTLIKHYREELDVGVDEANGEVANSIWHAATGREIQSDGTVKRIPVNATLAIWWSKTRMGWREPPREDAASNLGGTIVIRGGISSVTHEPNDKPEEE
jgi:hypothetical protein